MEVTIISEYIFTELLSEIKLSTDRYSVFKQVTGKTPQEYKASLDAEK